MQSIAVFFAFVLLTTGQAMAADAASSETEIRPLLLGSRVPDAPVQTLDGKPSSLSAVVAGKPSVLVFYRGGWCPYCNLQLAQLQQIQGDLKDLGFRVVAISPDPPAQLHQTLEKHSLEYVLVSDNAAAAMKAFGVAYRVDQKTLQQYHGWNIDIANGVLPVPSVFIVDGDGAIQFSYAHPDYKIRVPGQVVLAAARAIAAREHRLHPQGEK